MEENIKDLVRKMLVINLQTSEPSEVETRIKELSEFSYYFKWKFPNKDFEKADISALGVEIFPEYEEIPICISSKEEIISYLYEQIQRDVFFLLFDKKQLIASENEFYHSGLEKIAYVWPGNYDAEYFLKPIEALKLGATYLIVNYDVIRNKLWVVEEMFSEVETFLLNEKMTV